MASIPIVTAYNARPGQKPKGKRLPLAERFLSGKQNHNLLTRKADPRVFPVEHEYQAASQAYIADRRIDLHLPQKHKADLHPYLSLIHSCDFQDVKRKYSIIGFP